MKTTPRGMQKHIGIFGKTNAGKSTLFNHLTGQDNAIVSTEAGTTTDPVIKTMELHPIGPVAIIDTAGFDDSTNLGKQRMEKTKEIARRVDLGLFVYDINEWDGVRSHEDEIFTGEKILVFTKCDLASDDLLRDVQQQFSEAVFLGDIKLLKGALVKRLTEKVKSESLIGDLVPKGGTIVMVVPIDSAAPKGRLILPQVQLLRDCLDHGIKAYVTRETELESALNDLKRVDLVVTDSQIFPLVNRIVPDSMALTSFSILLARQKGNFSQLLAGLEQIPHLKDGDKILMLEGCTHSHTHEDIGRVKIPNLFKKQTKKELTFDFYSGYDLPKDLSTYQLVVLCGGCMLNHQEVTTRLQRFADLGLSATNYGVILAHFTGILPRCKNLFKETGGI